MEQFTYKKYSRNCSLEIVTACINSGQRVDDWCQRHSIKRKAYYYHVAKLRREGKYPGQEKQSKVPEEKTNPGCVTFCEINLPTSKGNGPADRNDSVEQVSSGSIPPIIVEYGQFRLSINQTAGKDLIANVMEAIAHV